MLSAKARSKAKLPICAMRENPNVFFQKPVVEATGTARKKCREDIGERTSVLASKPDVKIIGRDFDAGEERGES